MPIFLWCSSRSTLKGLSSTTSNSGRSWRRCAERGVLIIASGNVVHNLYRIDWSRPEGGLDWAHRFDDAAREHLTTSPAAILGLRNHADFPNAVPTPDHFLPLLYLAGLADAAGSTTDVLVDGYAYGSLSMTSFTLDAHLPRRHSFGHAAPLPSPDLVPTDDTNTSRGSPICANPRGHSRAAGAADFGDTRQSGETAANGRRDNGPDIRHDR